MLMLLSLLGIFVRQRMDPGPYEGTRRLLSMFFPDKRIDRRISTEPRVHGFSFQLEAPISRMDLERRVQEQLGVEWQGEEWVELPLTDPQSSGRRTTVVFRNEQLPNMMLLIHLLEQESGITLMLTFHEREADFR